MKMTKRFVALLMAVAMCMGIMSMSAFAAEIPECKEAESVFDLPDDAVILAQNEVGIIYQSKEQQPMPASTYAIDHNYVTINRDTTSRFSVNNPNKGLFNHTYGTILLEGGNSNSKCAVEIAYNYLGMSGSIGSPTTYYKPSQGNLYFKFNGTSNVTVYYYAVTSTTMTINCWLYSDQPLDYDSRIHLPGTKDD